MHCTIIKYKYISASVVIFSNIISQLIYNITVHISAYIPLETQDITLSQVRVICLLCLKVPSS